MKNEIVLFTKEIDSDGTHLRGYLPFICSFEEAIGRLLAMSQQDIFNQGDTSKSTFEVIGMYEGNVFRLCDYKGDYEIHIGGDDNLNVDGLVEELIVMMENTHPIKYKTMCEYTNEVIEYCQDKLEYFHLENVLSSSSNYITSIRTRCNEKVFLTDEEYDAL